MDIANGDIKNALSGFEEACVVLSPVMERERVRGRDLPAHHEKEEGKLAETFSIFKARMGPTSMSGGADNPD